MRLQSACAGDSRMNICPTFLDFLRDKNKYIESIGIQISTITAFVIIVRNFMLPSLKNNPRHLDVDRLLVDPLQYGTATVHDSFLNYTVFNANGPFCSRHSAESCLSLRERMKVLSRHGWHERWPYANAKLIRKFCVTVKFVDTTKHV